MIEQVIQLGLVPRDLQVECLEFALELRHPGGVPGQVELHLVDHPGAVLQRSLLGQVAAVAGGVEGQSTESRQAIADEAHDVALSFVGEVP